MSKDVKSLLRGIYAPMCTPFISDEVDYAGYKKNIEKMNGSGIKGLHSWYKRQSRH